MAERNAMSLGPEHDVPTSRQPVQISRDTVQHLFDQVAAILKAMGDGTVQVIDGDRTAPKLDGVSPAQFQQFQHRPTIKELRAAAETPTIIGIPRPRRSKANHAPRKGYTLVVPAGGTYDLEGLSAGAIAIVKYLALHDHATIKQLMDVTGLKRSTIANTLTVLRNRNLVRSEGL
jgi:DNA-binding transcriptional ArsR family regulator